ncbi:SDR family NAD(P)-dependent oxidoreductase [Candidatus Dojkabacteria bacterium]|nr:SDR family NAD(P)-dependent oxidoreductase [Candidatus Dojkabacteria bacterium]
MKLKDKTILITGASSGIGKAVALRSAQDGATVILASRSENKLNDVKSEIEKKGGRGVVIPTDVTKSDEVKNLFLKASKDNGVIDVVFNNAGLGFISNIWEMKAEEIEKIIDVNVKGMILVAKYAAEIMVRQQYGHMIMTSSLAGLITVPQWAVYVGSKWAITGFADSIRHELRPYTVKVSTLHPGGVRTDFFAEDKANIDISKMGDTVSPEEVAEAVYEAIFTNQKKILIPKMAKSYSFLYKYFPAAVDKMLEKQVQEIEYHENLPEDEPEFSYVKCVKCDS